MIRWKKLKNGLAVLMVVTMVGQPLGVYAGDFTSEAEVESYAEEETDTELETEDEKVEKIFHRKMKWKQGLMRQMKQTRYLWRMLTASGTEAVRQKLRKLRVQMKMMI